MNWIKGWGGADVYNEVYGKFGMVYLPYGVTNNESGFRTTSKPIKTTEDLKGLNLRVSGLEPSWPISVRAPAQWATT